MWSQSVRSGTFAAAAVMLVAFGCEEQKPPPPPPPPAVPAPPPTPPPAATPTPAPSASAAAPVHDCPKDAPGDGTFAKPCEGKGASRMMDVAWTGKTDDKGPWFRVVNKTKESILYGRVAVYFYDKAGKQLETKEPEAAKAKPFHTCAGMMFAGIVKPAEKITIQLSCVPKNVIPADTKAIEAEMQVVGYADASEKKIEWYWRNTELTPDARKKGGIK